MKQDYKPESDPEVRRLGLGGSDAGIVLGVSRYKTRFELWQEKTGRKDIPDLSGEEHVQWGNLLEAPIAEEYARRSGNKVRKVNKTLQHPDIPFMRAHIDRKIQGVHAGLEVKTVGIRSAHLWGDEGSDQIPLRYKAQVLHYLAVTGYEYFDVAALIGGQHLRLFRVDYNEEAIDSIIREEMDFWSLVQKDVPPSPVSPKEAVQMFPKANEGEEIIADDNLIAKLETIHSLEKLIDQEESQLKECKAYVQEYMKGAERLLHPESGRSLVTWKTSSRSSFDKKRFEKEHPEMLKQYQMQNDFRTFRINRKAI